MRIIALDTALGACSVAAWQDGALAAHRFLDMNRGHAEILMTLLDEVEAEAGFGALEADRLAVTVGPGTFTGLRVGLAAAKGLALAAGVPLVGLTTLQVIAAGAEASGTDDAAPLAVVLDARRGDVYLGLFARDAFSTPLEPSRVLPIKDAEAKLSAVAKAHKAPLALIGTGVDLVAKALAGLDLERAQGRVQPDAAEAARLAAQIDDPGAYPPDPLYLRGPDAKLPTRNPLA